MEDNLKPVLSSGDTDGRTCARCQINPAEHGYTNAFCQTCRVELSRHPIPKWLWFFAGGVLCLMLIGMYRMPAYIGAAIHMSRAEKALDAHKYKTASRELEKVLAVAPKSKEANTDMYIASAYNMDMVRFSAVYNFLEHQEIDKEYISKINEVNSFLSSILPSDTSIRTRIAVVQKDSAPGLMRLADSVASEETSLIYVANSLYELKAFDNCRAVLNRVLDRNSRSYTALYLMAAVCRRQGQYDEAINYCNRLLSINMEDPGIYAQMAKVEMKRKDNAKADGYLQKAMDIDSAAESTLEARTLMAYLTGKNRESERLLAILKNADTTDDQVYRRTEKIVHGAEAYQ